VRRGDERSEVRRIGVRRQLRVQSMRGGDRRRDAEGDHELLPLPAHPRFLRQTLFEPPGLRPLRDGVVPGWLRQVMRRDAESSEFFSPKTHFAFAFALAITASSFTSAPFCRLLSSAASRKANSSIVSSAVTGGCPVLKNRAISTAVAS
jgi:hypothetical protein